MGNPLYGDDQGKMCYNPAKSFFLGWYDAITLGPSTFSWTGEVMGVGEWKNNPGAYPVAVKIELPSISNMAYYIGFNRAAGANSQNDEGDDLVTVTEANNADLSYQSWRQALLQAGQEWTQYLALTNDLLTVTVNSIDKTSVPGKASITITLGPGPPTPAPTPCTQAVFKLELQTGKCGMKRALIHITFVLTIFCFRSKLKMIMERRHHGLSRMEIM